MNTDTRNWRKSSYSGGGNACVELPGTLDAVRDSKNGAVLRLTGHSLAELLTVAKSAR